MIPIKNIYYMLSYAFRVLKHNNYKSIDSEDFEHIEDLCSHPFISYCITDKTRAIS